MDSMVAACPAAYRAGAVWHISRAVEKLLHEHSATSGDYIFDVRDRVRFLRGFPVRINDTLSADGTTSNDLSATFGDHRRAVIACMGSPMVLSEILRLKGGELTFYSQVRAKAVVRDAAGLVGLVTSA